MRLLDLRFTLSVNDARCLAGMLAICLALGGSPSTAIAESTFGGDVVVVPWSATDRTFLWAGPVNTFRSGIFLLGGNCEILLDGKKVSVSDLKSPMVGSLTFLESRSGHIPSPNRMNLRSIRFDPLTKDEHRASLPSLTKAINPTERDIEITDYKYMEFRKPGPKAWGSVLENWHARSQPGILKGATEQQIVIAPWNPLAGRGVYDPKPKMFTVPVTRVVNIVSSEYIRPKALPGNRDVRGGGIGVRMSDSSRPTETYYYNTVTHVLESSLHRDAYLLGAAPDIDVQECQRICEHYKKDWTTICGAERVWAFRLLHYAREQQAQWEEDKRGWRHLAALGTLVWLAGISPSIPSVAMPTSSADKEISVTVLKTIASQNVKLYWTQYGLSDAINTKPWSTAAKGADGHYYFKCNPRQPLWIKVNDGKATRIELSDRDTVIERLP